MRVEDQNLACPKCGGHEFEGPPPADSHDVHVCHGCGHPFNPRAVKLKKAIAEGRKKLTEDIKQLRRRFYDRSE